MCTVRSVNMNFNFRAYKESWKERGEDYVR